MLDPPKAADPVVAAPPQAAPAAAAAAPVAKTGRSRWFWINLVVLMAVAPFATYWFRQHLAFYFTEISLIGGGITVWALLRGALAVGEKLGKLDPLEFSRRWLASRESTLMLGVAVLCLAVLWFTTTSLYFEYAGGAAGDRDFVVRVTRTADGTPYMGDITVGPAQRIAGQARLLGGEPADLTCTIIKPLRYEPLPCAVRRGKSTRVAVPAKFAPRAYHLLRIVPGAALYSELPHETQKPRVRYALQMTVGGQTYSLADLRRQTVYLGGKGGDLDLVLGFENPESYERFLGGSLRAAGVDEQVAAKIAATLALRTRDWDALDARAGQELRFKITSSREVDGRVEVAEMPEFSATYKVTDEKVQTIWIPSQ